METKLKEEISELLEGALKHLNFIAGIDAGLVKEHLYKIRAVLNKKPKKKYHRVKGVKPAKITIDDEVPKAVKDFRYEKLPTGDQYTAEIRLFSTDDMKGAINIGQELWLIISGFDEENIWKVLN